MNYFETKKSTAECTEFVTSGITNICNSFGPRPCGSDSEKYAQEQMAKELEAFCDSVTRETFNVHPKAFMSFVPHAGACLMGATAINLATALGKGSKLKALGSAALMGGAVSGIVGEFLLYKKMYDPIFKKETSGNVIAVRKAKGETKRRIIISGHSDSAPEWTYTYKLGSHGVILHIFEECHGESFAWKFFSTVHRPVSVLEIVVFHAAELLDVAVAAVMVGHEKSFCRDDFSCASAAELHYGILQRRIVYAVDLLRCEFAAEILHGLCVHLLDQRKKPHSLICPHAACKYCQSSNNT